MSYGWMGRSPDYNASFLGTLGANADLYAPYSANAERWYRESQEKVVKQADGRTAAYTNDEIDNLEPL